MPNAWESNLAAVGPNSILKDEVTALNAHNYPVSEERYNSMTEGEKIVQRA
jgi:hypothetical protein